VKVARIVVLSALSGCVWALIASFLARSLPGIRVALLLSPLIGVVVGLAFRNVPRRGFVGRALVSLIGFYLAVVIFGLVIGIADAMTGPASGPGWRRDPFAVVLQGIIGTLWGVTFTGWILFLWPLAYLNFMLVEPPRGGEGFSSTCR
jgi:hypothetical protein